MIAQIWEWLTAPENWTGSTGILVRLIEHVQISALALVLAAVIGIPLGLYVGHTGKGRFWVQVANGMRALPTLGLLYAAVLVLAPYLSGDWAFLGPSIIVLVLLAVPPILAGTYSGVDEVDPAAKDAARGMGMTSAQVLRQVEVPNSLPLMFSGLRSAALQVIATATIAATVSIGGLGRYLIDGQAFRDFAMMSGGALLVALLALVVELIFVTVERVVISPGLRAGGREGRT